MPQKFENCDLSDKVEFETPWGLDIVATQAGSDPQEADDCAIVALAITTDLPYDMIHDLARVCLGRKYQKPTLNMVYASSLYPFRFKKINKKRFRLSSLAKRYPNGRYYIQVGGRDRVGRNTCHAIALVDGKIYERPNNLPLFNSNNWTITPFRWVTGVWSVTGLKSSSWWGWKRFLGGYGGERA